MPAASLADSLVNCCYFEGVHALGDVAEYGGENADERIANCRVKRGHGKCE
jgi:hypothetical protein